MLTSPVVTVSFSPVLCSYLTNASCAPRAYWDPRIATLAELAGWLSASWQRRTRKILGSGSVWNGF